MSTYETILKTDSALCGKHAAQLSFFMPVLVFSLVFSDVALGQSTPSYVPGEALVKFKSALTRTQKDQFHAQANVDILSEIPALGVDRVKSRGGESTEVLLNRYKQNPLVEYVEPNGLFKGQAVPNDPMLSFLYGLFYIGAPNAWDLQTGSASVVVADIDSGVDYNHEDLAANIWTNPTEIPSNGIDDDSNGYIDDIRGWNFVSNNNNPYDDNGHGTHTSGTIAAIGNNALGVVGVTWTSTIMPVKFLNAQGEGSWADAALAITYAADEGARISNNSYGCLTPGAPGCYSQTVEDAIAYANSRGMLFVVAAMNNGSNNDAVLMYPCNSTQPNVICVAATDGDDQKAGFSNYGATTVHLGAPGVYIRSTTPGNTYSFYNGTSMATPHVSGAAALLLAEVPSLTVAQLKAAILDNVDPLTALSGLTVTGGRLNVDRALRSVHSRLINISTRAKVGIGFESEVAGFIITGGAGAAKEVLLRGFGPTLTGFGVPGALANPIMVLQWDHDNNPSTAMISILTNDDWGTAVSSCPVPIVTCGTPQDIVNTGMSANSYAPTDPNRVLDSAMLVTLPPGTYTLRLSGVNNGTGIGLIGVDDLD